MIPVPILVMLSVVGLLTYLAIGCVVAGISARCFECHWREGNWQYMKPKDRYHNDEYWKVAPDAWTSIGLCVAFWPAWLAGVAFIVALMGVCYGIYGLGYFPLKVGQGIVRYVAQIGEGE